MKTEFEHSNRHKQLQCTICSMRYFVVVVVVLLFCCCCCFVVVVVLLLLLLLLLRCCCYTLRENNILGVLIVLQNQNPRNHGSIADSGNRFFCIFQTSRL